MAPFSVEICGYTFIDSESPPEYVSNLESSYSVDYYKEIAPGYLLGLQAKSRSSKGGFAFAGHKGINRRNYRAFKREFYGEVIEYDRDPDRRPVLFHPESSVPLRGGEACNLIEAELARLRQLSRKVEDS